MMNFFESKKQELLHEDTVDGSKELPSILLSLPSIALWALKLSMGKPKLNKNLNQKKKLEEKKIMWFYSQM